MVGDDCAVITRPVRWASPDWQVGNLFDTSFCNASCLPEAFVEPAEVVCCAADPRGGSDSCCCRGRVSLSRVRDDLGRVFWSNSAN